MPVHPLHRELNAGQGGAHGQRGEHRGLNAGQDGAHGQQGKGGSWEEEGGEVEERRVRQE